MQQISRILRTVVHLKPTQLFYQIIYRLSKVRKLSLSKDAFALKAQSLVFIPLPSPRHTSDQKGTFTFLNLSKSFSTKIDWNFMDYGKLWNYNLQYADFINQENLPKELRILWMKDLYQSLTNGRIQPESYPASLRSMNVIRFLSDNKDSDGAELKRYLHTELSYLNKHYEYHLLGNHLLENAFAMLMGGLFLNNELWIKKAEGILIRQLNEQILNDGAHFELSPMYHQIILFRVLECIGYLAESDLKVFLKEKAERMLGWLSAITFKNGDIPHFNDSTDGVAFSSEKLMELSRKLCIYPKDIILEVSGYRKFILDDYELVADVNGISPDYQPGHNHADHLSFVMYFKNAPFIVDPGTSTYSISPRRQWERSSKAHNTVTIDDQDQSEVWGGFRVGRRASVNLVEDLDSGFCASIKYSSKKFVKHTRRFDCSNKLINIKDDVSIDKIATARFYLDPNVQVSTETDTSVGFSNGITMNFKNTTKISIESYLFSSGFNKILPSNVIIAYFKDSCETSIKMN